MKIINFIEKAKGPTKNQVVEYMKREGFCTHVTTRKMIDDLISDKKVVFSKQGTKGFYHLYINDENEFNQINSELTKIEDIIEQMKPKIICNPFHIDKVAKQPRHNEIPIPFYIDTFYYYRKAVDIMLQMILFRTKTKIHSEVDANMIYRKVIELMIRLTLQIYDIEDPLKFLKFLKHILKTVQPHLPVKKGPNQIVSIEFINSFIRRIESFEKHVLTS